MTTKTKLPPCPVKGWKWAAGLKRTKRTRFLNYDGTMRLPLFVAIGKICGCPVIGTESGNWYGYIQPSTRRKAKK